MSPTWWLRYMIVDTRMTKEWVPSTYPLYHHTLEWDLSHPLRKVVTQYRSLWSHEPTIFHYKLAPFEQHGNAMPQWSDGRGRESKRIWAVRWHHTCTSMTCLREVKVNLRIARHSPLGICWGIPHWLHTASRLLGEQFPHLILDSKWSTSTYTLSYMCNNC